MFALTLISAWNVDTWHSGFLHSNSACRVRYPMCLHEWHVCEVYCGWTHRTLGDVRHRMCVRDRRVPEWTVTHFVETV